MNEFKLNSANLQNGIYILSQPKDNFESVYLKVREKEKRIFTDDELANLPFASAQNPHKEEWELRAKSYLRFVNYLKLKKDTLNILDIGCGNGWFCGQLSKSFKHSLYCLDVNLTEMIQGIRVFNQEQIKFIYADIFTVNFPLEACDLITINAAIQYFPDPKKLLNRLLILLADEGEIHIMDSPVYSEAGAIKAKQRTQDYYSSLGFPEMKEKYFHHTWNNFRAFNSKVLYNPRLPANRLKRIFRKDSPFPWIRVTN
jgi:SAM-dependent methyltransferase